MMHLTGAPYHHTTNGDARRLVQTFKQNYVEVLVSKLSLQEF